MTNNNEYANIQAMSMPESSQEQFTIVTPAELVKAATTLNGDMLASELTERELFAPQAEFAGQSLARHILNSTRNGHVEEKLPAGKTTNPYVAIEQIDAGTGRVVRTEGGNKHYFTDAKYRVIATTNNQALREIYNETRGKITNHNEGTSFIEIRVPKTKAA